MCLIRECHTVVRERFNKQVLMRMANIHSLHSRLGFHRIVNECDILYYPDGEPLSRALTEDDYVMSCMAHKPPAEREAMEEYIKIRSNEKSRETARMTKQNTIRRFAWERIESEGEHIALPEEELDPKTFPEWDDVKRALSRVYSMPNNPPKLDKPILERLRNGEFRWIDGETLKRRESNVQYCIRSKNGNGISRGAEENEKYKVVPAVPDFLKSIDTDIWVINNRPPTDDVPSGYVYEECTDGIVQRAINIFRLPQYRYMRYYRRYKYMAMEKIEQHLGVRWYQRHIRHLIVDPEMQQYWLNYMSHMFQFPHVIPRTYIWLYSEEHGVGKDVALLPIQVALGPVLSYVGGGVARTFSSTGFTDIPKEALLVTEDEIGRRAAPMNQINQVITTETRHSRKLYEDAGNIPNHIRLVTTSNNEDSFDTSQHERRQAPMDCTSFWHRVNNPANFEEMIQSMNRIFGKENRFSVNKYNTDSICALAVWLERRDISKFDPVQIPMTHFVKKTRGGAWADEFLKYLAKYEYAADARAKTGYVEKDTGATIDKIYEYSTHLDALYKHFSVWWKNAHMPSDDQKRGVVPVFKQFKRCFCETVDRVIARWDRLSLTCPTMAAPVRWTKDLPTDEKDYMIICPASIQSFVNASRNEKSSLSSKDKQKDTDGTFEILLAPPGPDPKDASQPPTIEEDEGSNGKRKIKPEKVTTTSAKRAKK